MLRQLHASFPSVLISDQVTSSAANTSAFVFFFQRYSTTKKLREAHNVNGLFIFKPFTIGFRTSMFQIRAKYKPQQLQKLKHQYADYLGKH